MRKPIRKILALALLVAGCAIAAEPKLKAVIVDGLNNHDWAAATNAIEAILEGSGRFTVDVSTWPQLPDFSRYDVVIDNYNGGHLETGIEWPSEAQRALESYVGNGGGLVIFHAANNAFLKWPEFNRMIGLGWRAPTFGPSLAIGPNGQVFTIPQGQGLPPGHGPRHDFEIFVRDPDHPITHGLPPHWLHPSEQLTHGQHGPAEGLTILTYAFSEVSRQGEPMDWVRDYGKGRVYTSMLGHTWKDETNPNLDDIHFQALLARGAEWAASGKVTLPADLGWKPLFDGKTLDGWEVRGSGVWTVLDGVLIGKRSRPPFTAISATWPIDQQQLQSWLAQQAWLYTRREFHEFDLHVEYWIPRGGNSGISIRDRSWAHHAVGESDSARPDLATLPRTTAAQVGYEIEIIDDETQPFQSGSIYTFVPAKPGVQRPADWNSIEVESRDELIRVRLNGQVVAEYAGDPARSNTGPIGLQLYDQFSTAMFRNIRIRERQRNARIDAR
ncbi:MAG TPA: family 16 glycoside hydrolase [Bryobacteraceae bacterium]|nr:family 16 glycoside hydrolase [Bryobacteraceae bacterium]